MAKKLLPRLLAAYRRRRYQSDLAAKRPRPPRWFQRAMRLAAIEAQRAELEQQLIKPEFE